MNTKPNIFEYIDYRQFLTDWRLFQKQRNPGLSHEYLCRMLGQKNRSFYNDLEKGRKVIGADILDRLCKLFELTGDEAKYFRALVGYGQPSTYAEKEFWFEQIIELNNSPKRLIGKDQYRYFKEWHHSSVRAVLDTCDIDTNYRTVADKLYNRITTVQARESIRLLKSLKLIAKNKQGFWKPTDKVLTTGDNVRDACIKSYQLAHHGMLKDIIQQDAPGSHNSTQLTVSVSDVGMERIVKRVQQLRSEIRSIAHKDEEPATRVYQIAVHHYPLSRSE